ncbi:MAG: hypothetical protein K8F31_12690, partial [Roseovarius sp.]|nr:hypothetical protein [Roseovarius sp.]
QISDAQSAKNGGIVRRKINSVHTCASEGTLEAEVIRRGFHMAVSGDQYVILCNKGQFQVIC